MGFHRVYISVLPQKSKLIQVTPIDISNLASMCSNTFLDCVLNLPSNDCSCITSIDGYTEGKRELLEQLYSKPS